MDLLIPIAGTILYVWVVIASSSGNHRAGPPPGRPQRREDARIAVRRGRTGKRYTINKYGEIFEE